MVVTKAWTQSTIPDLVPQIQSEYQSIVQSTVHRQGPALHFVLSQDPQLSTQQNYARCSLFKIDIKINHVVATKLTKRIQTASQS